LIKSLGAKGVPSTVRWLLEDMELVDKKLKELVETISKINEYGRK
jgi:hypothetical protein